MKPPPARTAPHPEAPRPAGGVLGRVGRVAMKAIGGAVYYAIYRRLPDASAPDPYWREMHPDQDKGTGPRGEDAELPPGI